MTRCRICRVEFERVRMTQKTCGHEICAQEMSRQVRLERERKEERKRTRQRLNELKTLSQVRAEAQAAVNAWVRWRDRDLPCISCGTTNPKQWHAGHYLSRAAHPELALVPRNIFKQCSQCNDYLSGNQVEMRKGILARMGQDELDWLEGYHPITHYSKDDLVAIKHTYKRLLKEEQACRQ